MTATTAKLASDKQIAFIKKLAEEKIWETGGAFEDAVAETLSGAFVTSSFKASAIIDQLLRQPRRNNGQEVGTVKLEDGFYTVHEMIIKAQTSPDSGRQYGKVLDVPTGKFVYQAGILRGVRPEHKLTLEKAKEFGKLYGTCCICGRTLTNEESIEAGIGPVCGGRL